MLGEERKKRGGQGGREGKRDRLGRKIITTPVDLVVSCSSPSSGLLSSGGIPQNTEFSGFIYVLLYVRTPKHIACGCIFGLQWLQILYTSS